MIDWLLRVASRRALSLTAPLVPLLGDTAAARGLRRGLDPQLAAMLALNERLKIRPIDTMPVPAARRFAAGGLAPFAASPPPMAEIADTAVPAEGKHAAAIPIRIYRPHGAGRALLLWFHGGGGVIGSVASSDTWTRVLAHETGCTVASVEYRLAPEHVHPAAVDDALAAWAWVCSSEPYDQIAVGGDSFGGFLAARVAAHAAAAGPRPLALQVLVYPLLDLSRSTSATGENAEGYLLTAALMRWFTTLYAPDPATHRAASPAFFPHLAGQAPAIVVTAGFDPLGHEGQRYADRLEAAGVAVTCQHQPALIHGFISMTGAIVAARAAAGELFAAIKAELSR